MGRRGGWGLGLWEAGPRELGFRFLHCCTERERARDGKEGRLGPGTLGGGTNGAWVRGAPLGFWFLRCCTERESEREMGKREGWGLGLWEAGPRELGLGLIVEQARGHRGKRGEPERASGQVGRAEEGVRESRRGRRGKQGEPERVSGKAEEGVGRRGKRES